MHTCVAHPYIHTCTLTLKGETLAMTKCRDFRKFWANLARGKYFCKNSQKIIPLEMNFKGQLDKN